jgi:integrase
MGSIRKAPRTGRWEARFRDSAGRQHTKTFDTKADARAFVSSVETDVQRGQWIDPQLGRITFAEWAVHVDRTRVDRRPTTQARDATLMRTRVLPAFGDRSLALITSTDIKAWIPDLTAAGLAASTVRKCYQLVSRVLEEATHSGLIAVSPCRRVRLPTDERPEPVLLTPEQVEALADAIKPRYRSLVLIAAYTGLRWGELAGLRLPRVDFLRRRIHVAEILTEIDGRHTFGPPKTKRSRAAVSMPGFLVEVLAAHVAEYPDPDRDRLLVFTSDDGTALRRSNFRQRVWIPAIRDAGLPHRATFHSLRHATASWLIDAGANPLEVAEKLRHRHVTTTLSVYGHLFPGVDARLDTLLDATHQQGATDRNAAARGADVVQIAGPKREAQSSGR